MTLRIKETAKEKGITLEQLSTILGINRVTLSRTINGNPTIDTIQRIADALEVDVIDLFEPKKPLNTDDPIEALKVIRSIAEQVLSSSETL